MFFNFAKYPSPPILLYYCARPMRFGLCGHRNALIEKAWEDAVQGLGKIRLSIVWKSNCAKRKAPKVKTGERL